MLATLVQDSSGAHDALCGTTSEAANVARYGDGAAQGPSPAGRELLMLGALKHGLRPARRAALALVLQGVRVGDDGALSFVGSAGAGCSVVLRAELPLVVLIASVPHPLDPRQAYTCTSLEVLAWRGVPTVPEDPLWSATPEGERAYRNTEDYATARGLS